MLHNIDDAPIADVSRIGGSGCGDIVVSGIFRILTSPAAHHLNHEHHEKKCWRNSRSTGTAIRAAITSIVIQTHVPVTSRRIVVKVPHTVVPTRHSGSTVIAANRRVRGAGVALDGQGRFIVARVAIV